MPLYLFEVGRLDSSTMAAYTKSCAANPPQTSHTSFAPNLPTKTLRLFATFENMIRFVIPLCSVFSRPSDKTPPVIQTTCIVDFSGVGLMQLWSLKNHMQDASTLATAHYPETLGRIFVCSALRLVKLLILFRSSARPPFFQLFGPGSRNGSIHTRSPRSSLFPLREFLAPFLLTSILSIFRRNMAGN